MSRKPKQPDLEMAFTEIKTLIEQMEEGNQSLEQSLDRFERGITLIKHCQKMLKDAEQKVQILIQNHTEEDLQQYDDLEHPNE